VAVDTQIPDVKTTLPDGPVVGLDGSSVLPDAPISPDALVVNVDGGIDSSASSVDGGIDSTSTPLGPTGTLTNTSTITNTVTSSNTVTNSSTVTSSNTATSSSTVTNSSTSTSSSTVTSSNTATVTVTSTGTNTQTATAAYVIGWPTTLDFGANDCPGTAPANVSFTLTNQGTGPAQFTQAGFLGGNAGFSFTDNIVGLNIFPYNRTFVVSIKALPIESGFALTDTLRIVTSIPGDPVHLIQISRSGTCGCSAIDCPTGDVFDPTSCTCKCPTGGTVCGTACISCTGAMVLNPDTCSCECPENATVHPMTFHAYYRAEWNTHQCDEAVWYVSINGVDLGIVNLNNEIDGGSRDSSVSATLDQVQQALDVPGSAGQINLQFTCYYASCHEGMGGLEVTYSDNGTVLYNDKLASTALNLETCVNNTVE
jgi:hypothetical protein